MKSVFIFALSVLIAFFVTTYIVAATQGGKVVGYPLYITIGVTISFLLHRIFRTGKTTQGIFSILVSSVCIFILNSVFSVKEEIIWIISITLGLATPMFFQGRESIANAISSVKSASDDIASKVESRDAPYLAIAEDEINQNRVDKGLWAQALVKAKGDESLRKIEYMKLRARQLKR